VTTTTAVRHRPGIAGDRRQGEAAIAHEARQGLVCDACGHRGLAELFRFDRQTGAYVPLCYCPVCGASVAF
jgi:hypothetical protein